VPGAQAEGALDGLDDAIEGASVAGVSAKYAKKTRRRLQHQLDMATGRAPAEPRAGAAAAADEAAAAPGAAAAADDAAAAAQEAEGEAPVPAPAPPPPPPAPPPPPPAPPPPPRMRPASPSPASAPTPPRALVHRPGAGEQGQAPQGAVAPASGASAALAAAGPGPAQAGPPPLQPPPPPPRGGAAVRSGVDPAGSLQPRGAAAAPQHQTRPAQAGHSSQGSQGGGQGGWAGGAGRAALAAGAPPNLRAAEARQPQAPRPPGAPGDWQGAVGRDLDAGHAAAAAAPWGLPPHAPAPGHLPWLAPSAAAPPPAPLLPAAPPGWSPFGEPGVEPHHGARAPPLANGAAHQRAWGAAASGPPGAAPPALPPQAHFGAGLFGGPAAPPASVPLRGDAEWASGFGPGLALDRRTASLCSSADSSAPQSPYPGAQQRGDPGEPRPGASGPPEPAHRELGTDLGCRLGFEARPLGSPGPFGGFGGYGGEAARRRSGDALSASLFSTPMLAPLPPPAVSAAAAAPFPLMGGSSLRHGRSGSGAADVFAGGARELGAFGAAPGHALGEHAGGGELGGLGGQLAARSLQLDQNHFGAGAAADPMAKAGGGWGPFG